MAAFVLWVEPRKSAPGPELAPLLTILFGWIEPLVNRESRVRIPSPAFANRLPLRIAEAVVTRCERVELMGSRSCRQVAVVSEESAKVLADR